MENEMIALFPFDDMAFREAQKELAKKKLETIVITGHRSPDGDALGASLGMRNHLISNGFMDVQVIMPDGFPAFYNWMPGVDEVILATERPEKALSLLSDASLIFCLDYNDLTRVGELMQSAMEKAEVPMVMLDHHQNPSGFAKWNFSDPRCGSTAELVYRWIQSESALPVSKDVAACLYTGLMTDTGSFRFPSVTPATHEMVADLLRTGMDHSEIHAAVYDSNRLDRLRLNGFALSEKLEVDLSCACAWIALTHEELDRFHAKSGDTEGLVNQALSVEGVNVAVFIRESEDGRIKLSLRSRGSFSVREVAQNHFNGGGHHNAAGGALEGKTISEVIDIWKSVMATDGPRMLASC